MTGSGRRSDPRARGARISRRSLLGRALAAGTLWGLPARPQATVRADRVLVVGAGIAGLACAAELRRRGLDGVDQLMVLEAADRIGGRIRTSRELGYPTELGAAWIHGVRSNPIAAIAQAEGLRRSRTRYGSLELFLADGRMPSQADQTAAEAELVRVRKAIRRRKRRVAQDESLEAAIDTVGGGSGLGDDAAAVFEWLLFWSIESTYAAALGDLSLLRWNEDSAFGGGDDLLPDGYDGVAQALARELDVRTSSPVRAIATDSTGVTVETDSASFRADAAVVTLPLGVLKAGSVTFEPDLPERTLTAVARLGFGSGLKVALDFGRSAWPRRRHFLGHAGTVSGESLIFSNLTAVDDRPALSMEAYGAEARRLEELPVEAMTDAIVERLTAMLGPLPDPIAVIRSDWNQSPFARGAYTYWATDSRAADLNRLRAPIDDRILLAGEHTSKRYPGTVHGAYLEGLRVARAI